MTSPALTQVVATIHLSILSSFFPLAQGLVVLRGEGASFPLTVYSHWIQSYRALRQAHEDVRINYQAIGSGAGKRAIIAGVNIDFAGSDSPLSEQEMAENPDLVLFPMLAGGIVLAYNIRECDFKDGKVLNLTRDHVVGIYNGTYSNWADPSLQAVNPNCSMPNETIIVVARSDSSGSTYTFTDALSSFDHNWASDKGAFSDGYDGDTYRHAHWDNDVIKYSGPSNQDVRGLLRSFPYSISYLVQSDAEEFELSYADIGSREGGFITANSNSIQAAMNAKVNDTSLIPSLIDTNAPSAYPIAGYTNLIIYQTQMTDCVKARELIRFARWAHNSEQAQTDASLVSMVTLTSKMAARVQREVFDKVTCNGQSVMELVLKDEANEEESSKPWLIPVAVTVPLVFLVVGGLAGYILYQRVKLNKMINMDEWDIPIDDIVFFYDDKAQGASSYRSSFLHHRSIRSLQSVADISEGDELLHHILQWPGKFNSNIVGIRLVEFKELRHITREMKKTMLWMRDHMINNNIVRFYGLSELEKDYYVIGDYCNKGSILNALQVGKYNLNDDVKLSFAVEIASGMSFLHLNGLVHGMLMCACCLLDNKWTVKISDWEFHKLLSVQNPKVNPLAVLRRNKDPALGVARDFWTAPELIRSEFEETLTPACDVYSFAIVMQELYTRDDPYCEHAGHLSPDEILAAVVNNRLRPEHGTDTPILVRQVMEIAWSDTPSSRPTFDQIVKLLRRGKTERKSILDNMMEAMEVYTAQLEDEVRAKESASISMKEHLDTLMTEMVPQHVMSHVGTGRRVESQIHNALGVVMAEVTDWHLVMEASAIAEVVTYLDTLCARINQLAETYKAFSPYYQSHQVYTFAMGLDKETVMLKDRSARVGNLALDVLKMTSHIKPPGKLPCAPVHVGAHLGVVATGVIGNTTPKFLIFGDGVDICKSLLRNAGIGTIRISRALYAQLEKNPDFELMTKEPEWIICNGKEIESYVLSGRLTDTIPIPSDTSVDSGVDLEQLGPVAYRKSLTKATRSDLSNNGKIVKSETRALNASDATSPSTSGESHERPVYLVPSSSSSRGERKKAKSGNGSSSSKKGNSFRNSSRRDSLGSRGSENRTGPALSRISENSDLSDISISEAQQTRKGHRSAENPGVWDGETTTPMLHADARTESLESNSHGGEVVRHVQNSDAQVTSEQQRPRAAISSSSTTTTTTLSPSNRRTSHQTLQHFVADVKLPFDSDPPTSSVPRSSSSNSSQHLSCGGRPNAETAAVTESTFLPPPKEPSAKADKSPKGEGSSEGNNSASLEAVSSSGNGRVRRRDRQKDPASHSQSMVSSHNEKDIASHLQSRVIVDDKQKDPISHSHSRVEGHDEQKDPVSHSLSRVTGHDGKDPVLHSQSAAREEQRPASSSHPSNHERHFRLESDFESKSTPPDNFTNDIMHSQRFPRKTRSFDEGDVRWIKDSESMRDKDGDDLTGRMAFISEVSVKKRPLSGKKGNRIHPS